VAAVFDAREAAAAKCCAVGARRAAYMVHALGVLRVVLTQSVSLCANVFLRGTMEEGRSDDGNNAGKIMAAEWSCDERTRALSRNNARRARSLLSCFCFSLSLFIYLPPPLFSVHTNSYRGGKDCCFYSIKLFN
jgi:hypothetical protein